MQIQIKNQTFAQRCEVCHKSDCYNSEKNYCSRCFSTVARETKAFLIREMGFWGQLVFFIVTSVTLMFLLAMSEVYVNFSNSSKEAMLASFLVIMFAGLSWFVIKVVLAFLDWFCLEINSLFRQFRG